MSLSTAKTFCDETSDPPHAQKLIPVCELALSVAGPVEDGGAPPSAGDGGEVASSVASSIASASALASTGAIIDVPPSLGTVAATCCTKLKPMPDVEYCTSPVAPLMQDACGLAPASLAAGTSAFTGIPVGIGE